LARARAAIRKAIRTQNFTSDREETYIPTGSVYRNPHAFHQLSFESFLFFIFLSQIPFQKYLKIWRFMELFIACLVVKVKIVFGDFVFGKWLALMFTFLPIAYKSNTNNLCISLLHICSKF
jgi:hypothetical protein